MMFLTNRNINQKPSWRARFFDALIDRLIKFPLIILVLSIFWVVVNASNTNFEFSMFFQWLLSPTGFLKGIPIELDPPLIIFLLIAVFLDALIASIYFATKKTAKKRGE